MSIYKKIVLRVMVYSCAFVFLLLGFLMLVSKHPQAKQYVSNRLISAIYKETGYQVYIEDIQGVLPFYISAKGVSIDGLTIQEVKACCSPMELFWQEISLPYIRAKGIQIEGIKVDIEGKLNYLFQKQKGSASLLISIQDSKISPLQLSIEGAITHQNLAFNLDLMQRPEILAHGSLLLTPDFEILESSLTIKSIDVGTFFPLPIKGKLKGIVKATGSLLEPTVELNLESSTMRAWKKPLSHVSLSALLKVSEYKIQGPLSMEGWMSGTPFSTSVNIQNFSRDFIELSHINSTLGSIYWYGNLLVKNKLIEGKVEGEGEDFKPLSQLVGIPFEGSGKCSILFSHDPLNKQKLDFELALEKIESVPWNVEKFAIHADCHDLFDQFVGIITVSVFDATNGSITCEKATWNSAVSYGQELWPFSFSTSGSWYGNMHLISSGGWHFSKEALDIEIDLLTGEGGKFPITLEKPLQLHADYDQIKINPAHLKVGEGDIFARIDTTDALLEGTLRIKNIPLEMIQSSFFPKIKTTGKLSATASIEGSPRDIEGRIKIQCHDVTVQEGIFKKFPPIQGQIAASLKKGAFLASTEIQGDNFRPIHGFCSLPMHMSLSPLYIDMNEFLPISGSLDVEGEVAHILQLLTTDTTSVTGYVKGHIDLSGTYGQPKVMGIGELREGTFESLATGAVMDNMRAVVEAHEDQLLLKSFQATAGHSGKVFANGFMQLNREAKFPFEFVADIDKAALIHLDYAQATASGHVLLLGDTESGSIEGEVTLDQGTVKIPEELPLPLKTVDVTYINSKQESKNTQPILEGKNSWPVKLNVHVVVPQHAFVTGRNLTSEWNGEITFKGSPEAPKVYGSLKMMNGEYLFNGLSFDGSTGTISFNGDPQKKTAIYVIGERDLEEIKAEVIVRGPLGNPGIVFRSNPPLPEKEILSWILFNRGVADIDQSQKSELNHSQFTLSAGRDETDMLSRIRSGIGIDRIDISNVETGELNELSLRVGKYLTRGVYISLNKGLNSHKIQTAVEANVAKNVKVQAEVGDRKEHKMSLKWEKDY